MIFHLRAKIIFRDLELLQDRQRKKCQNLELICKDEEFRHWQDISNFQEKNKVRERKCLFKIFIIVI